MPSALETLIKILRLEQETGFKNTAVIGGLETYVPNWTRTAHQEAKTNQQHALIEELSRVLSAYGAEEDRGERQVAVKYLLGRITGRVQPRPELAVEWTDEDTAALDTSQDEAASSQPDIIENNLTIEPAIKEPVPRKPRPRRLPRQDFDLQEAISTLKQLNEPVITLKGVGEKRAAQLAKLGIHTVNDLLFHFPRRYDDYTRMYPLHRLPVGQQIAAIGTISRTTEHISRQGKPYLRIVLDDGGGTLTLAFFNQMYLKRRLTPNRQIVVYGKVERYQNKLYMTNPDWEPVDQRSLQRGYIVPVYRLTKGVGAKAMRKLIKQAIDTWSSKFPDYVPESVLERTEMVDLGWALRQIHFPKNWDYIEYARERLAFDELLILQMSMVAKRLEWQSVPGIPLPTDDDWLEVFKGALPYELTSAQARAVNAIRDDVNKPIPMNRLLQGDVGAGKTVVAAIALSMAIANGKQAALMAPTSILAEQHYQNLSSLLAQIPGGTDINIELLTGATPDKERQEIYAGLEDGSLDLIVGTHALIQGRVTFNELAMAVIDEQHRFGVDQRGALRGKGTNPHVLVMTATPIPRTLALTMYADLDLTVLDEMPPGRTPIETRLLHSNARERAYRFIINQLEKGRQAFIIYPLVESSDQIDARSAVEAYEELQHAVFMDFRVGLMHGRLSPSEKDEVMAAFAHGEIDVLISTTVIEVGIDIPNASVMLIESANRFGLAQLHQLRGRVGRGSHDSYCLLISDSDEEDALDRLRAVEATTDGFVLAELDWKLRGAGDLLGTRQAGFGPVQLDTAMDVQLVEMAQQESRAIIAEDPELNLPEHALLEQRIHALQSQQTDLS